MSGRRMVNADGSPASRLRAGARALTLLPPGKSSSKKKSRPSSGLRLDTKDDQEEKDQYARDITMLRATFSHTRQALAAAKECGAKPTFSQVAHLVNAQMWKLNFGRRFMDTVRSSAREKATKQLQEMLVDQIVASLGENGEDTGPDLVSGLIKVVKPIQSALANGEDTVESSPSSAVDQGALAMDANQVDADGTKEGNLRSGSPHRGEEGEDAGVTLAATIASHSDPELQNLIGDLTATLQRIESYKADCLKSLDALDAMQIDSLRECTSIARASIMDPHGRVVTQRPTYKQGAEQCDNVDRSCEIPPSMMVPSRPASRQTLCIRASTSPISAGGPSLPRRSGTVTNKTPQMTPQASPRGSLIVHNRQPQRCGSIPPSSQDLNVSFSVKALSRRGSHSLEEGDETGGMQQVKDNKQNARRAARQKLAKVRSTLKVLHQMKDNVACIICNLTACEPSHHEVGGSCNASCDSESEVRAARHWKHAAIAARLFKWNPMARIEGRLSLVVNQLPSTVVHEDCNSGGSSGSEFGQDQEPRGGPRRLPALPFVGLRRMSWQVSPQEDNPSLKVGGSRMSTSTPLQFPVLGSAVPHADRRPRRSLIGDTPAVKSKEQSPINVSLIAPDESHSTQVVISQQCKRRSSDLDVCECLARPGATENDQSTNLHPKIFQGNHCLVNGLVDSSSVQKGRGAAAAARRNSVEVMLRRSSTIGLAPHEEEAAGAIIVDSETSFDPQLGGDRRHSCIVGSDCLPSAAGRPVFQDVVPVSDEAPHPPIKLSVQAVGQHQDVPASLAEHASVQVKKVNFDDQPGKRSRLSCCGDTPGNLRKRLPSTLRSNVAGGDVIKNLLCEPSTHLSTIAGSNVVWNTLCHSDSATSLRTHTTAESTTSTSPAPLLSNLELGSPCEWPPASVSPSPLILPDKSQQEWHREAVPGPCTAAPVSRPWAMAAALPRSAPAPSSRRRPPTPVLPPVPQRPLNVRPPTRCVSPKLATAERSESQKERRGASKAAFSNEDGSTAVAKLLSHLVKPLRVEVVSDSSNPLSRLCPPHGDARMGLTGGLYKSAARRVALKGGRKAKLELKMWDWDARDLHDRGAACIVLAIPEVPDPHRWDPFAPPQVNEPGLE